MTKINLKSMKEAYLNSDCDNDVWCAFYTLCGAGMIDWETWSKFFDCCNGWTPVDGKIIDIQFIDGESVEKIIRA